MGEAIRNYTRVVLFGELILSDGRRRSTAVSGQCLTGLDIMAGIVGELVGRLSGMLSMNGEFGSRVGNSRCGELFDMKDRNQSLL